MRGSDTTLKAGLASSSSRKKVDLPAAVQKYNTIFIEPVALFSIQLIMIHDNFFLHCYHSIPIFPSIETRFTAPAVAVQSFLAAGSTIFVFFSEIVLDLSQKKSPRVVKR